MNKVSIRFFASIKFLFSVIAVSVFLTSATNGQCPVPQVTSGLRMPLGITQSNQDNLLVSETGNATLNSGRLSILGLDGTRRTLLDGLPSAINDVGDPSGPAGLFIRGRTLYVAMGVGDVGRAGPLPGTTVPNPNGVSSPIFSSVLAIHFSANVEKRTTGFTLSVADQQTLAAGEKVTLYDASGNNLTIEMVANFPNYTPNPLPIFPGNIRLSNPFDLVVVGDQLYVTDGGQNAIRRVDIPSGTIDTLVTFPSIPNPLPILGPFVEAVPTGIRYADGQLLVTLFRGAPFPPGTSVVEQVDPVTGTHTVVIGGLKTAIDVQPISDGGNTSYFVLQHAASTGPFFPPPGNLARVDSPGMPPVLVANCLTRPTSMVLDEKTQTMYVTEFAGRVVSILLP